MTTKSSLGRFKIPTAQELKDTDEDKLKPSSLFKAYKEAANKNVHESKEKQGTSSSGKVSEKSSTVMSSSDIINRAPVVTMPNSNTCSVTMTSTNTSESVQTSTAASSKNLGPNTIIVNFRQRGNPLLKHIRNVPWEYASIVPDYVMGRANCALFLSLRYHQLHSDYLHSRLKELGKGYDLRVLLVQVDVKEPHHLLKELTKICILADLTLILAFSAEEAGRYLEAYKVYENKTAEALMERSDPDFVSKVTDCLTTVKSVNKTDSMSLLTTFKSMDGIIQASKDDIAMCPGFGPQKAQRLYDVFHEPFLKSKKRQAAGSDGQSESPQKKPK